MRKKQVVGNITGAWERDRGMGSREHDRGKSCHYYTRKALNAFLRLSMLLVLFVLAGCQSSASSQPAQVTPLALTPSPTASKPASQNSTDWTTYHRDNTRAGYLADMPDPQRLTQTWNTKLDGAVYGEPLVVSGRILVATENDTLYALNAQTGQTVWQTHVGTPVAQADLPCGDIFPLGITGTPVYDSATGLVFAVAEITGPNAYFGWHRRKYGSGKGPPCYRSTKHRGCTTPGTRCPRSVWQ